MGGSSRGAWVRESWWELVWETQIFSDFRFNLVKRLLLMMIIGCEQPSK